MSKNVRRSNASAKLLGVIILAGWSAGCASGPESGAPGQGEPEARRPVEAAEPAPRVGEEPDVGAAPAATPKQEAPAPAAQPASPQSPPRAQSPGEFTRIGDDARAGPPEWFRSTPVLEDGRLTLSADASARTAREARAAAVDAGIERMRASLGFEPRDTSVLLTHVERLPTGWYKAYVMMTASASEQ